jgi:hypothetical protein
LTTAGKTGKGAPMSRTTIIIIIVVLVILLGGYSFI